MEGEAEELPCPHDLLRRLSGQFPSSESYFSAESASGEIDLRLGLSLGIEHEDKGLVRSSSISSLSIFPVEKDSSPISSPLARTCSLPVDTDVENRKRKEMQSLKRLEAKRKREEKRNFSRSGTEGEGYVGVFSRSGNGRMQWIPNSNPRFDAAASRGPEASALNSSSVLEMANSPSPSGLRSLRSVGEDEEAMKRTINRVTEADMMAEMPCVSTTGDGPNGRRIEGFLYRYKKGEDVSIVCVCHGSFLSPAEFIRHAGGGDVEHPLRHIVVNPLSSST